MGLSSSAPRDSGAIRFAATVAHLWILAFVRTGGLLRPPLCYYLKYDSLSEHAHVKNLPRVLRLGLFHPGPGEEGAVAAQDTTGVWGTPLAWNTYRVRGDSIEVWLADGNRELRILGRTSGDSLDAQAEIRTDVAGRQLAHAVGRSGMCWYR